MVFDCLEQFSARCVADPVAGPGHCLERGELICSSECEKQKEQEFCPVHRSWVSGDESSRGMTGTGKTLVLRTSNAGRSASQRVRGFAGPFILPIDRFNYCGDAYTCAGYFTFGRFGIRLVRVAFKLG